MTLCLLTPIDHEGTELAPVLRTVISADSTKPIQPKGKHGEPKPAPIPATVVTVHSGTAGAGVSTLIVKDDFEGIMKMIYGDDRGRVAKPVDEPKPELRPDRFEPETFRETVYPVKTVERPISECGPGDASKPDRKI